MSSRPGRPARSFHGGAEARRGSDPEGGSPAASAPACHPLGGCITCSDEGVPMRVVDARPDEALALCTSADGSRSDVMTDLVGRVSPGDRLLVHAGTALLALDSEADAAEAS